jgi:hypothetical protein
VKKYVILARLGGWKYVVFETDDRKEAIQALPTWQEVWVTMKREILEGPKHG